MALEIERKFLVNKSKWNALEKNGKFFLRQGYVLNDPDKTIRVRITDSAAYLTIKGRSVGATRSEFEYEIPKEDAVKLLDQFSVSGIEKYRHEIPYKGKLWEVDEFLGDNLGLVVAEIELESEEETFELPDWIEKEVTGEEKYYNSNLSVRPFKRW